MARYAIVSSAGLVVNVVEYATPPARQNADGSYNWLDVAGTINVGDTVPVATILSDIVENDPLLKALFKECFRLTNEVRQLRTDINGLVAPDPYTAAQAAQVTAAQYRTQVGSQF